MNDYKYQITTSWKLEQTEEPTGTATITIYRVGYSVNFSVVSQSYTISTAVAKQNQILTIPSVPNFLCPNNTINFTFRHIYTSVTETSPFDERASLIISGDNLIISAETPRLHEGEYYILPINLSYTCLIDGPTSNISSYGPTGSPCSLGPITPSVVCTYFLASRANTSNITVSYATSPTLAPFPTIVKNYSLSGTWSLGTDLSTITIPLSGVYQFFYTIAVSNDANNTRTVSSCLYINNVSLASSGSTTKLSKSNTTTLIGQGIVLLTANDQLKVYVLASGNGVTISGTSSLFVSDNTSTTFAITKIG